MLRALQSSWRRRRLRRPLCRARLQVELLEGRELLSNLPLFEPVIPEISGNVTLDAAQQLGALTPNPGMSVLGNVVNAASGAAGEAGWYTFSLSEASQVQLAVHSYAGLSAVLSLYNSDPFDFGDYYDPDQHRLLGQDDGQQHGGDAALTASLATGTYYVAVSGSGDPYFSPFLADSGYAGSTGPYVLSLSAVSLGFGPTDGPQVLASAPASQAALTSSPLVLRVDFSTPIDPGTISLGDHVTLTYNPTGNFGNGADVPLGWNTWNVSTDGTELQLQPAAPLLPGYYQLHLDTTLASLPDDSGTSYPLGANAANPAGRDYFLTFQVTGVEGQTAAGAGSDDTPASAHVLGDITQAGRVQVAGAIGDDPTDPIPFDPSDVDLYEFTISGTGNFALAAEAFAGRIGSPLDVALSLFEMDSDQQLHLLAANDNTLNTSEGTNGTLPLFADAALFAGLQAGTYYVAVSSSGNMPDPINGPMPGDGVFDPTISQSGQNGSSTGPYVLNLSVQADNIAPQVVATSPFAGESLDAPPTELTVQFSKAVNVQTLAFQGVQAIYVQGADGTLYYPRLLSFDPATNEATFMMLDSLANGTYQLHLSGPQGLADFGANPLVGNDPSGDYVAPFTVLGPPRGSPGDPLTWTATGTANNAAQPQVLGTLFPNEMQLGAGVNLVRDGSAPATGSADYYEFQVLQSRPYFFDLTGTGLDAGTLMAVFDMNGNLMPGSLSGDGSTLQVYLSAGTYLLQVGSWTPGQADAVAYQVQITLGGADENPTPLTVGPAPVLQSQAAAQASSPAPLPAPAPPAVLPAAPPLASAVPAEVLLALGSGPIGGVTGVATPPPAIAFFSGSFAPSLPQFASLGSLFGSGAEPAPTGEALTRVAHRVALALALAPAPVESDVPEVAGEVALLNPVDLLEALPLPTPTPPAAPSAVVALPAHQSVDTTLPANPPTAKEPDAPPYLFASLSTLAITMTCCVLGLTYSIRKRWKGAASEPEA